jgi:hypothetical protein
MSKKWVLNEDIYILHWCCNGIEVESVARDLGRSVPALEARMAFLNSGKGDLRRRIAEKTHAKLRVMAREIVALENLGFDFEAWFYNEFPTNDFNAATMPEHFGNDRPEA